MTADLEPFLDAGDPPIVFTLGSAAVFDPGDFFVESYKAVKAIGRRAIMLAGTQPGRMPPPDPAIGVFPYEPFSRLFPRAAAIVHQGGSGTTGQVMRAGKPMLVVPYAHDQADNAFRVTKLGIARTVRRRAYRSDTVGAALHRLLDDAAVARCAREVGTVVSREEGAAAADAIESRYAAVRI
jgi:UDP:flavonoid glycosyltransferase YjiC (YdhE family)